ncbi:hypothetical protein [Nocardiopsis potens]|uniref:hypothetical protein n=1 Tax=Nocardiopsis potens TaxID=1246458 RepID=UPI00034983BF|nr:hypothetical protein [Nocardiopsis potens]
MKLRSRAFATATALAIAATCFTAAASPASAAPKVSFGSGGKASDGSRNVNVAIDGSVAGRGFWNADPGSTNGWPDGDTLYVIDSRSDGYAISADIVHAHNTPSYSRTASTSGRKAPVTVKRGGNLAEGRKLQLRVCVTQGSRNVACSPYYSAHA